MPRPLEVLQKLQEARGGKEVLQYPDSLQVHFPPDVNTALNKGTPYTDISFFKTPQGIVLSRFRAILFSIREIPRIKEGVHKLNEVERARKEAHRRGQHVWNAPHIVLGKAEYDLEKALLNQQKQNGRSGRLPTSNEPASFPQNRVTQTKQELLQTHRQAAMHRKELKQAERDFAETERRIKDHLEFLVEEILTADPKGVDGVLGYTLSHPKRRKEVFAQFSDNFRNPELAIKQLEERYFKLKHQR